MRKRLGKMMGIAVFAFGISIAAGCGKQEVNPAGDSAQEAEEKIEADRDEEGGNQETEKEVEELFDNIITDMEVDVSALEEWKMDCHNDLLVDGELELLAGRKLSKIMESGWTPEESIQGTLPSCQISNDIMIKKADNTVKVKLVNPYDEEIPLERCDVCWLKVDETSGNVTDSMDFACGSSTWDSINKRYEAPYNITDTNLTYKSFGVSYMELFELGSATRVLKDDGWEISYGFKDGILETITMESPSLLYNGLADNINPEVIGSVNRASFQGVIEARNTVLDKLKAAFSQSQVNVQINEDTGEVTMDSNVLFAVDSYELSEQGKQFLDSFCSAYGSVVLNDEFSNIISEIVFEGHTDTSGEYEYNLELSKKRAAAVLDYCLASTANGLSQEQKEKFQTLAKTEGYSFSDPVFNEDGEIDMEASRRVAVKFYVNVQ